MEYLFTVLIVLVLYGCQSGDKKHAEKIGDINIVRLESTDTDSQLLTPTYNPAITKIVFTSYQ